MNLNGPDANTVQKMFGRVAGKYDLANSVLSAGIHHLWRQEVIKIAKVKEGQSVLDCATGTGDLAIEFKKAVGAHGQVTGTDFCPEMLAKAPLKAQAQALDIKFELADAMALPFADQSFDIVSIAFGIRNVSNPAKALAEMARVTKPGGRVMVLEFGQVQTPGFKQLYNFYSEKVLPLIGGMVTGEREAYEYLQKSSASFPSGEAFVNLMHSTRAYNQVTYKPLSFGIAYIYSGIVN